jgi:hypothetical protein
LKPPVTELPRRESTQVEARSAGKSAKGYFGISYHKGSQRWVGNREPLGATYPTAKLAYQALLKKKPSARSGVAKKRAKISVVELVDRTRKLVRWGEKGPEPYLPPDVLSSVKHARLSSKMYQAEPGLEMLSLHLKYEPWKDALLASWKALGSRKPAPDATVTQRAELMLTVAKKAAERIASSPVAPAWPRNANRFRHREQGPSITLRNLGVVGALALDLPFHISNGAS